MRRPPKPRAGAKRRASSPPEAGVGQDVARWSSQREGFEALHERIVRDVVCDALTAPEGPVLEVGAGAGQLRAWLPTPLHARLVHLDRNRGYLRVLQGRAQAHAVLQANAQALPVQDGALVAALGLCALDVLPDLPAFAHELHRVLRPRARLVHFLDLATNLEPVLADAIASHAVALPNFLAAQPDLVPPGLHSARAPEVDLLLLPHTRYAACVRRLAALAHPLTGTLAAWGQAFLPDSTPKDAARVFVQSLQTIGQRQEFVALWLRLFLLSQQNTPALAPLPFAPLSSTAHFRRRLKAALETAGFETLRDEVVVTTERRPNDTQTPPGLRTLRALVGQVTPLPYDEPHPPGTCPLAGAATSSQASDDAHHLVVCGVHVFVAERV